MIVLDTSFLVSFYLTNGSNHDKAITAAEKNSTETMFLSEIILFETLTVLNYKGGIALARAAYEELLHNEKIRFFYCTDEEKNEMQEQFFGLNTKTKLSFADVSVIYLAKKSNASVLTFDEAILKAI